MKQNKAQSEVSWNDTNVFQREIYCSGFLFLSDTFITRDNILSASLHIVYRTQTHINSYSKF